MDEIIQSTEDKGVDDILGIQSTTDKGEDHTPISIPCIEIIVSGTFQ